MRQRNKIKCFLHSKLDAQWTELMNIYFARDKRVEWTDSRLEADFVVLREIDLNGHAMNFFNDKRFIVLSFGDLAQAWLGIRPEDADFRRESKKRGAEFFYLQAETSPKSAAVESGVASFNSYTMDGICLDDHITVLTLPLGYCSGSKINLFYEDNDETTYHINNMTPNPKDYEYDWCWIGAESSRSRADMFRVMDGLNGHHKYVVSDICKSHDKNIRKKALHADNKTVPYDQYIDFHRRSKVCVSANGVGSWNYKDAEFFANNCFNLRQYNDQLSTNPFSPKNGKHWQLFKNDELHDMIAYYLENDEERERINDAGHEYFKKAISGGWAAEYSGMFLDYLSGAKRPFEKVAYGR